MPTRNIQYRSDIIANRTKYESRIDIESNAIADKTWSHELFLCCDACGLCCITALLPCVTFGANAKQIEAGSCCFHAVCCLIPFINCIVLQKIRTQIRMRYGISGSSFNDFLMVCFCAPCTILQEAKQLKLEPGDNIARTW
ncbi:hypothetical protein ACHWQZ_G019588 [Mnemiopsis leidyi]